MKQNPIQQTQNNDKAPNTSIVSFFEQIASNTKQTSIIIDELFNQTKQNTSILVDIFDILETERTSKDTDDDNTTTDKLLSSINNSLFEIHTCIVGDKKLSKYNGIETQLQTLIDNVSNIGQNQQTIIQPTNHIPQTVDNNDFKNITNNNDNIVSIIQIQSDTIIKYLSSIESILNKKQNQKNTIVNQNSPINHNVLNSVQPNAPPVEEPNTLRSNFISNLFIDVVKHVEKLDNALSKKLIKKLDEFGLAFERLLQNDKVLNSGWKKIFIEIVTKISELARISKDAADNMSVFSNSIFIMSLILMLPPVLTSMRKFTSVLASIQEAITSLRRNIIALMVAMSFPGFVLSMQMVASKIKQLREAFGEKPADLLYISAMKYIGLNLLAMALSLIAFNYVEWSSVGKMLLFIGGLALIMKFASNGRPLRVGIGKQDILGIGSIAGGITLLVGALLLLNYVQWSSVFMLLTFITGLFLIIRVFGGKSLQNAGAPKEFLTLSAGLSLMVLAVSAIGEVNWIGALALIGGFILGLSVFMFISNSLMGGGTMKAITGNGGPLKGILGFAIGIAILLITVEAIGEVNWKNGIILVGFIIAISLALAAPSLLSRGKMNGQPVGGMLGFSIGIAILLLAVNASSEIDWTYGFILVGFVYAMVGAMIWLNRAGSAKTMVARTMALAGVVTILVGAIWLISKLTTTNQQVITFAFCSIVIIGVASIISMFEKQINGSIKSAFKLMIMTGLLSVSMSMINKISLTHEQIFTFGLGVSIIMGVSIIAGLFSSQINRGITSMLGVSIASALAATSLFIIGHSNMDWNMLAIFGTALLGLILITALVSLFVVPALIGAGGLILIGASMIVVAGSFMLISIVSKLIDNQSITTFVESIKVLVIGISSLIIQSVMALPATTMITMIAIGSLITAGVLYAISLLKYNTESINQFKNVVSVLLQAYTSQSILSVGEALLKSGMITMISVGSLITGGILFVLSKLKYNPKQIKQFRKSLQYLIESYNQLSIIELTKATIKAGLLVPITTSAIGIAGAMRIIQALNIDKNRIISFGDAMRSFIKITTDAINSSVPALKAAEPGLDAVAKLASAAGAIATVVESYANMTIGIWAYDKKSGTMRIVERKPINDSMIESIGTGIGKMLQALINPLSIISGEGEYWDFGNGVKVKNPFGKSGFFGGVGETHGVKRIEMIANAYIGLPKIFNALLNNNRLFDDKRLTSLGKNLPLIIGYISDGLIQANSIGIESETLKKLNTDSLNVQNFYNQLSKIINTVYNITKYKQTDIDSNFDKFKTVLNNAAGNIYSAKRLSSANNVVESIKNLPNFYDLLNQSITRVSSIEIGIATVNEKFATLKTFLLSSGSLMFDVFGNSLFNRSFNTQINNIRSFYDGLSSITTGYGIKQDLIEVTDTTERLLNSIGDKHKFTQITKNLRNTNSNIKDIVSNINKINIPKALALEKNLRLLTESRSINNIAHAVKELQKLIGMLVIAQQKQIVVSEQQAQSMNVVAQSTSQSAKISAENHQQQQRARFEAQQNQKRDSFMNTLANSSSATVDQKALAMMYGELNRLVNVFVGGANNTDKNLERQIADAFANVLRHYSNNGKALNVNPVNSGALNQ